MILTLSILVGLVLLWLGIRWYTAWSPGIGSQAPGVQYLVPPSASTVVASSGNVAAATATATLPAVAGKTNILEGFDLTGSGPTTASAITMTVTGLLGGTQTWTLTPLAGVLLAAYPNGIMSFRFPTPLVASAQNVAIAVVVPSLGSGSTNSCVVAYGLLV